MNVVFVAVKTNYLKSYKIKANSYCTLNIISIAPDLYDNDKADSFNQYKTMRSREQ